jgi:pimeloyl-ACP methyl ester carboxylesterase
MIGTPAIPVLRSLPVYRNKYPLKREYIRPSLQNGDASSPLPLEGRTAQAALCHPVRPNPPEISGSQQDAKTPRNGDGWYTDLVEVVISGTAHMVNLEEPAEFNRALLNFLRK